MRKWLAARVVAACLGIALCFAGDADSSLLEDKNWEQARKDLAQGNAKEAKAAFEALLKKYPVEADLYLFLGMSLLRLRDPQAAVLAIKKAIEIDPNHVEARTLLGYVELEVRGDVNAAIATSVRSVRLMAVQHSKS